jgi:phosphate transport system substrate-binding protein
MGPLIAVIVVIVIVVAALIVAYQEKWFPGQKSSTKAGACSTGTELQGNGAQFAAPLFSAWSSDFSTSAGNQVNYVAGGSGTGLTSFSEHPPILDFAVTDDPLTSAENSSMPAAPLTLPIAGGALTIVYNLPHVSGHLNLTGAVLEGIYNGTITSWSDPAIAALNPGPPLPSSTIVPVIRADPAGTTYVLTDFLSQSSTWWANGPGKGISIQFPHVAAETAVKGNSLVISTVSKTSYSIGYSDLTDVLSTAGLQYAAIQNPQGANIVPTITNTESALVNKVGTFSSLPPSDNSGAWYGISMVNAPGKTDYPLATFIYLYVYQAADKGYPGPSGGAVSLVRAQTVVQWLHYLLSAGGQAIVDETSPSQLYYAPLPASVITTDLAGIQSMTYNGAAIPACT